MNVLDELLRVRGRTFFVLGPFGCYRADGSFVVEAVEVAAGLLEVLDPFVRLQYGFVSDESYIIGTGHFDRNMSVNRALMSKILATFMT